MNHFRNRHFLIIDDNSANAQIMQIILARWGGTSHFFTDGPSRRNILSTLQKLKTIDLILLDLMLPDTDGYEIRQWLLDDPISCTVKVALVTAASSEDNRARARQTHFQGFIEKPIRTATFNQIVLQILDGHYQWD